MQFTAEQNWVAVLPTLRFSHEFGLVFFVDLWSCGFFFWRLAGCLFLGLFNWNLLVFWAWFLHISVLRIAFFQMLWHFCCFKFILLKAYWACFCENLLILGLFFRICHHDFLFDFLADFCFVEFSCQRTLACFSVKLRILGLFFKFTYSWKITWDHCWVESRLSLSLGESRLSHRLELLFNLCGNKVKTVWNWNFYWYYLVKPDEAKKHIFSCEAK